MLWDVANGVGRRAWAGGECANFYSDFLMEKFPNLKITIPNKVSEDNLNKIFSQEKWMFIRNWSFDP